MWDLGDGFPGRCCVIEIRGCRISVLEDQRKPRFQYFSWSAEVIRK